MGIVAKSISIAIFTGKEEITTMKSMIFGLFFLAYLGTLWAKTDTVWTVAGNGNKAPAYWHDYTFGIGASVDTATVDGYRTANFSVKTSGSNGAGYGFGWEQNSAYKDVPISLSAYKGACLTYKANAPVRMDFKQSTISDDNYYGTLLDSASDFKTVFVAFANLDQDWKSSTPAWNVSSQLGIQFSYKNTIAKTYGATNTFTLAALIMGDSCVTYPPELLEPYKSKNADGKIDSTELAELDTLSLVLSKIFFDRDSDALKISARISNIVAETISLLNPKTEFGLSDTIRFVPKANLNGEALVVLVAKDAKDSAVYKLIVETKDVENPPVAVRDSYMVDEDDTLTVSLKGSILRNDYDIDGTPFDIKSYTKTSHGKLSVDTSDGTFSYIPDANYCGLDSWTYTLIDTTGLESKPGTVSISVKCINDPPTVTVKDSSVFEDISYLEDFGEEFFKVPMEKIQFADVDGDVLAKGVVTDGNINASLEELGSYYMLTFHSVEDFFGISQVTLFATDGKDSAKFTFPVTITPVKDLPKARDDSYEAYEDSVLVVSAKEGVLANDVNPDDSAVLLRATLKSNARHGLVVLEEDGSFTYLPDADFFGADTFTYFVVNDLLDTSNVATVALDVLDMNDPPFVVADTAAFDTLVRNEDFTTAIRFKASEVKTWFTDPDSDKLYFSASSDDGKLNATITTSGDLFIKSVKDSTGDAFVTVRATDSISGTASFKIHVYLTPVNDKPVARRDTIVELKTSGFEVLVDLDTLFTDPDGDSLAYEPLSLNGKIAVNVSGSTLTITPANDSLELTAGLYLIRIRATDAFGLFADGIIVLDIGGTTKIAPQFAQKMTSWKTAILASRGTARLYGLNGRLLWQGNLPVSESEVRNAASRFGEKTILRINRASWMLSPGTI